MADLGTLTLGTYTNVSNTAIQGSDPVLETIAGTDDNDWVYDATNSTHTGEASFALADTPSDFGVMSTVSIRLRYAWQTGTQTNSWNNLNARIFKSDGTTALTALATVASSITTTTLTNSSVINFTGVDTAANKADWDGAVVRIYFDISKTKSGDTLQKRVYAAEVTGTYVTLQTLTQSSTFTSSTNAFYSPTVNQSGGVQNLTQNTRFDSTTNAFYTPTVTPGAVTLTQNTRFDNSNTFNAHTLVSVYALSQSALYDESTDTFYAPTVTYANILSQTFTYTNTDYDFYAATLLSTYTLTQNRLFPNIKRDFTVSVGGSYPNTNWEWRASAANDDSSIIISVTNFNTTSPVCAISYDKGASWSTQAIPNELRYTQSIVWTGSYFCITGGWASDNTIRSSTSVDGITWTTPVVIYTNLAGPAHAHIWDGTNHIVAENGVNSSGTARVYTSADATSWTDRSFSADSRAILWGTHDNTASYLLTRNTTDVSPYKGQVYKSTNNGVTWSATTELLDTQDSLSVYGDWRNGVAANDNILIAYVVWARSYNYSTDKGSTWNEGRFCVTNPSNFNQGTNAYTLVWNGKDKFIAVEAQRIYASENGLDWEIIGSNANYPGGGGDNNYYNGPAVDSKGRVLVGGTEYNVIIAPLEATITLYADQSALFTNTNTFYAAIVDQNNDLSQNTRFDNTNSFYAHTVTPGAVTLTPSLFDESTDTFYAHVVSQAGTPQSLTQDTRFDNANAFYSPTATTTYSLISSLYNESTDTFYTPVINATNTLVQDNVYTNTNSVFAASLSYSNTLTPSLYTNINTYYGHTLVFDQTLAANLYNNANTFYGHVITNAGGLVQDSRFDNINTFYLATIAATYELAQSSTYTATNNFYSATVYLDQALVQATTYTNSAAFYTAQIDLSISQASVLQNTNTFYSPIVGQGQQLAASLLTNTNQFFNAQVSFDQVLGVFPFDSQNTFYQHFIIWDRIFPQAERFNNVNIFYTPNIISGFILTPPLLQNKGRIHGFRINNLLSDQRRQYYIPRKYLIKDGPKFRISHGSGIRIR